MKTMNRRQMLGKTLLGTLGGVAALDQLGNLGWMEKLLLPSLGGTAGEQAAGVAALRAAAGHMGTFELLSHSLRDAASMLRVQQAYAQGTATASNAAQEWAVVTIKVVNHIYTPLVFRLGQMGADNVVTTAPSVKLASDRFTTAKAHIVSKGVDLVSDNARWRELRFNKWFADLLQTGKSDTLAAGGGVATDASALGVSAASVFPAGVAVQAGLHLVQEYTTKNHSLLNFRVRASEGDLAHFVAKHNIIQSPLGTSAFMMGDEYDRAEGGLKANAVLADEKDVEVPVASGRSVADLVATLSQSVAGGYVDKAAFGSNLVVAFDNLVDRDPKLRRAMLDSAEKIGSHLSRLKEASTLESVVQNLGAGQAGALPFGALQTAGSGARPETATAPRQEFLAQCHYTAQALRMEGRPVRNFSLFLNCVDLDGNMLDSPQFAGGVETIRGYTYVEGMRQLALGLHVLSKVIDESKNVLVVVVSEGGRSLAMGDDKVSFGLVMGPKGPGLLADALYADTQGINQIDSALVKDPGALPNPTDMSLWAKWNVDGLVNDKGTSIKGEMATTTGDWQLGVADFLAEKMGAPNPMGGLGRYVKLRRG